MSTFRLAVGLHNHQPVGNFDSVFHDAHRHAYRPFLDLLKKHPSIRMSLHQSGILWGWQKTHYPEFYETVGQMVDSGQLELMTGGYYEPILTSIPERDARGQISMLTRFLKQHFATEPGGLWLTERIWEPHLPKLLAECGVRYLPIDDTHFVYAGFEHSQLTGPFVTEHEGMQVTLLPIQKKLRYLIPFGKVEKIIDELKRQAESDPEGIAIYADDGEKFGVWPETYEHCYEDGWLEDFLGAVEDNSDWLSVVPLGEAAESRVVGRAYLPSASYAEMLHWSLPPKAFVEYEEFEHWLDDQGQLDRFGRFVRGGHWRGFLAKYEESNLMHKKMLDVSERLSLQEARSKTAGEDLDKARDHLYAGQCNCPYWHGVFGGLYLPHIRKAIYSNLIEADSRLDSHSGRTSTRIDTYDYDCDGHPEPVVRTPSLFAVLKPKDGGSLRELSLYKPAVSLTDTLTRRREGYHMKLEKAVLADTPRDKTASIHDLVLAKEEGLESFVVDDWYLRRCFLDHFFSGNFSAEAFLNGKIHDEGDFTVEPFDFDTDSANNAVRMTRLGHLWRSDGAIEVQMVKLYRFGKKSEPVTVTYTLSCPEADDVLVNFGVEQNFNFQAGHTDDRYVVVGGSRPEDAYLDSLGTHTKCRSWGLIDDYQGVGVGMVSDREAEIWRCPLFTVSLSEGGFEKVYQGTTVVNLFTLRLGPDPMSVKLALHAGILDDLPDEVTGRVAVETSA